MKLSYLAALIVSLSASAAYPELKTKGVGKARVMDAEQFTPEQRARYDIFKVRCTKCHPMARPIAALTTGVTPVTGSNFDKESIKTYVVKMMRKPNSGIAKDDAKEILLFLQYAYDLARPEGTAPATPAESRAAAGEPQGR